jgi:hypothetical protein
MAHVWMSHVTHLNMPRHTYEWVMSHVWTSHVTRVNEICYAYGPQRTPVYIHESFYINKTCDRCEEQRQRLVWMRHSTCVIWKTCKHVTSYTSKTTKHINKECVTDIRKRPARTTNPMAFDRGTTWQPFSTVSIIVGCNVNLVASWLWSFGTSSISIANHSTVICECKWIMSHVWIRNATHVYMSRVTHMNTSVHTRECAAGMSQ